MSKKPNVVAKSTLDRRQLLTRGAVMTAAGAAMYSAPTVVRAGTYAGGMSPPAGFTDIDNPNPTAGDIVTITGFGLPTGNPAAVCSPCVAPLAIPNPTTMTAQVLNVPGTFMLGLGLGAPAIGFGTIENGVPAPQVNGLAHTGAAAATELPVGAGNPNGPTITIGAGAAQNLPVSIVGGQICIDFNPFGPWQGGEKVETEFHFDTDIPRHCDYWDTSTTILNAGSVNACAALMGIAITSRIALLGGACANVQFSVAGGQLKIFFPGANITAGHTGNHVSVTPC